jgi:hypothetical protein
MSKVSQIFRKGEAGTPMRFWEYALRTENKHSRLYDSLGFIYSESVSKMYNSMSDKEKEILKFKYINGKKQY